MKCQLISRLEINSPGEEGTFWGITLCWSPLLSETLPSSGSVLKSTAILPNSCSSPLWKHSLGEEICATSLANGSLLWGDLCHKGNQPALPHVLFSCNATESFLCHWNYKTIGSSFSKYLLLLINMAGNPGVTSLYGISKSHAQIPINTFSQMNGAFWWYCIKLWWGFWMLVLLQDLNELVWIHYIWLDCSTYSSAFGKVCKWIIILIWKSLVIICKVNYI